MAVYYMFVILARVSFGKLQHLITRQSERNAVSEYQDNLICLCIISELCDKENQI
jgi:hypothetical protein